MCPGGLVAQRPEMVLTSKISQRNRKSWQADNFTSSLWKLRKWTSWNSNKKGIFLKILRTNETTKCVTFTRVNRLMIMVSCRCGQSLLCGWAIWNFRDAYPCEGVRYCRTVDLPARPSGGGHIICHIFPSALPPACHKMRNFAVSPASSIISLPWDHLIMDWNLVWNKTFFLLK